MAQKNTTAVDDIDKKEPTNIPSDSFAPHNCKLRKFSSLAFILTVIITCPLTKPDWINLALVLDIKN